MTALEEIAAERMRQIDVEGWSSGHDDTHNSLGHLAIAAACYAMHAAEDDHVRALPRETPREWPFASKWWKPGTRRRDLVKAAALIMAEIERLDRAGNTS